MKRSAVCLTSLGLFLVSGLAQAQVGGWGRFSLFYDTFRQQVDQGTSRTSSQYIGNLTLRSAERLDSGMEYALDARGANGVAVGQTSSTSIYDAWVGGWTSEGRVGLRLGQMWITELGGLGALGGGLFQVRQAKDPTKAGRWRFALFAGAEPQPFNVGFVPNVKKAGAFVAYDGPLGRRSVLGYVTIRDGNLTERSVVTTNNFIPVGMKFFVYQVAEYDLQGPGGQGHGGMNYFFTTVRWAPVQALDVMAMYHHGISVDTRSITNDELAGRPVDPRALEGFLFESANVRASVNLGRSVRVWAGVGRDRNALDSAPTGTLMAGFSAVNIARAGIDFTATDTRRSQSSGPYHSTYVSVGKTLGPRFYVSADYTTSLSVFKYTDATGVQIVNSPESRRYSLSATWNVSRTFSLLLTGERLFEDTSQEDRILAGIVVRIF